MNDDIKPSCYVLEVFKKRIYDKYYPKEFVYIIKKKKKYNYSMFIGLAYHIGIELSRSGINDCNNGRFNLGAELMRSGDLLISFARKTSRNKLKLTLAEENKIFGSNSFTNDVHKVAIDVSKMSYKFVGEFIIYLSECILQCEENDAQELCEIGNGIINNIWNNICKKYSKEI